VSPSLTPHPPRSTCHRPTPETAYVEHGASDSDARHAERVSQRALRSLRHQDYGVVLERVA